MFIWQNLYWCVSDFFKWVYTLILDSFIGQSIYLLVDCWYLMFSTTMLNIFDRAWWSRTLVSYFALVQYLRITYLSCKYSYYLRNNFVLNILFGTHSSNVLLTWNSCGECQWTSCVIDHACIVGCTFYTVVCVLTLITDYCVWLSNGVSRRALCHISWPLSLWTSWGFDFCNVSAFYIF